jgi:acetyl-CoA carboxylase carboxyl transferase subunit alpha
MGLTADRLQRLGLIDELILEPLGGAHRDVDTTSAALGAALERHVAALAAKPIDQLLAERQQRIAGFGAYTEVAG